MFVTIIKGSQGFYYIMNGKFYDIHFPLPWAIEMMNNWCMDCDKYGEINGVFVAYCEQCTRIMYKGTRGFYDVDAPRKINLKNFEYMKGVCESDIGESATEEDASEEEGSEVSELQTSELDVGVSEVPDDCKKCLDEELVLPKIEEAIMLGHITFRERLYNTMYMCTNN